MVRSWVRVRVRVRVRVVDGGDGLQIQWVVVNILNKQSRFGVEQGVTIPHRKQKTTCY